MQLNAAVVHENDLMNKPRGLIIARIIARELFLKILDVVDGDGADLIKAARFRAGIELWQMCIRDRTIIA